MEVSEYQFAGRPEYNLNNPKQSQFSTMQWIGSQQVSSFKDHLLCALLGSQSQASFIVKMQICKCHYLFN